MISKSKENKTYDDTSLHHCVSLFGIILVVVSFLVSCAISASFVIDWFNLTYPINVFMIPVYFIVWLMVTSFIESFMVMFVLMATFVTDEQFEKLWTKYHEKRRNTHE